MIPQEARKLYSSGIYLPERVETHRNKIPGIFTPAPSQELFFPELDSGIKIPSYPQESVFLARNNIPEIFRNFFREKKILQECLHPKNFAAE